MTTITVPLAALIGLMIGMLASGVVNAAERDEVAEYLMGTLFLCALCVLLCCGLEALINLGGA